MDRASSGGLNLRCFGPFEALLRETPLPRLELRESGRLLAFLALRANRLVPSIRIAEALWPDTGSLDSLHQSVRHARHALGDLASRLESRKGYLCLHLENGEADVWDFDRLIARGDEESLERAVSLHSAPLLELWDDSWVQPERERRLERYLAALRALASTHREKGEHSRAAGRLREYMRVRDSEDWLWRELMACLVAAGERVDALRLYEQSRETVFRRIQPPDEMSRLAASLQQAGDPIHPVSSLGPLGAPGQSDPTDRYVPRPADERVRDAVGRLESVVLLQGPAESGKTALLARGLDHARQSRARVAQVDLRKLSGEEMAAAREFYVALIYAIAEQIGLDDRSISAWNEKRSANTNFDGFVRREILARDDAPFVLGLDEVDRLFERPFGADVFALFRSWHNARSLDAAGPWRRLCLVLSYSSEARLFIPDLNQSPFNVGVRIPLSDFTPGQVAEMNRLFGSPIGTDVDLSRFIGLVGGHPGLAHIGLRELAAGPLTLDQLVRAADREDGPFGPHLRRLRALVSQDETLTDGVRELLSGRPMLKEESFYRLRAAGLAAGETEKDARIRCSLYARYLERRLA